MAVGDFNRDGNLDAAIEGGGGTTVLLGDGNGGFQSVEHYTIGSGFGQIAVGDFNGDGVLDLAMSDIGPAGLSVLTGNGDGTFQPAQFYPAGVLVVPLAVGDFNGDHKPDVVLLDRGLGAITLLNTGVVAFSPTTPLNFKKQAGTTSPPQTVTLTNTGRKALTISSMKAAGQFGMTSTCGSSVAAGAKCTISVTFSPKTTGEPPGFKVDWSVSAASQAINSDGWRNI